MYKLEAIKWKDHWTTGTDWVSPEETKEAEYEIGEVLTVGFIVFENDELLVSTPTLDCDDGSHRLETCIIKAVITNRTTVSLDMD